MRTTRTTAARRRAGSVGGRARTAGVALPIALILIGLITWLAVTQVKRSMLDERLAAATRETTRLEVAADLVLRWCEAWVIATTGVAGAVRPVTLPAQPLSAAAPAWRTAASWDDATTNEFTNLDMPGITFNRCMIEDATGELGGAVSALGQMGGAPRDPRFVKFRLTAQVRTPAAGMRGIPAVGVPDDVRAAFVQSELRLYQ